MKLFLLVEIAFLLVLIIRKLFQYPMLTPENQLQLINRWSTNFSIEIVNRLIVLVLFRFLTHKLTFENPNGTIYFFILYIFILDLVFYWRHRFYHRWFWRVHQLHHSDSGYDFTLSLRIHPVESIIQVFLFMGLSYLLKVSQWQFILAAQIFTFQALLSHFETPLPKNKFTLALRNVFVCSQDHRHHHCPQYPDRNFGFLFSFWDRIFHTSFRN